MVYNQYWLEEHCSWSHAPWCHGTQTCEFSMAKKDILDSAWKSKRSVLEMNGLTSYWNPMTIIMTWPHPIAKGTGRYNSPHAQNRTEKTWLCMSTGSLYHSSQSGPSSGSVWSNMWGLYNSMWLSPHTTWSGVCFHSPLFSVVDTGNQEGYISCPKIMY